MTLIEMTYKVLKENIGKAFTARQLAEKVCNKYPHEFETKRANSRFKNESEFITQVAAEIGRDRPKLSEKTGIVIDKLIRPQLYLFNPSDQKMVDNQNQDILRTTSIEDITSLPEKTEEELYPLLGSYLMSELNIYSKRIDEKKSKNNRGPKGNIWLHPDIVGLELIDEKWNNKVKDSIKGSGDNRVKLFSFEVKKKITPSNLRENFFQAVSNSSWANQGFLVAESFQSSDSMFAELKMLSTLHGIGFIRLNSENPSESQVILQPRERPNPDWISINRLVNENSDFEDYITSLKVYYESSVIRKKDWYK